MNDSEKMDLILEKIEKVDKIDEILEKMDKVDKIDEILVRMDKFEADMVELKTDVAELKTDVTELKTNVTTLNSDVTTLKEEVKGIKLTIETQVMTNIRRVAEGHLDLSRKLDAAVKKSELDELTTIRVGVLEVEVGEMKKKIS